MPQAEEIWVPSHRTNSGLAYLSPAWAGSCSVHTASRDSAVATMRHWVYLLALSPLVHTEVSIDEAVDVVVPVCCCAPSMEVRSTPVSWEMRTTAMTVRMEPPPITAPRPPPERVWTRLGSSWISRLKDTGHL